MQPKFFTLSFSLILFTTVLTAQNLHIDVGMNLGASQLYHQTRFEETPLHAQYNIAKELFQNKGIEYTWDEFAADFGLRNTFIQPRFGFSARLSYKDWPIFGIADVMSSTSSYTKVAYSGTIGMGQDFYNYNEKNYISLLGGYKYVYDRGFGSSTLVNAVGDASIRKELATFFNPKEPLGRQRASLFTLRGGVGRVLDEGRRWRAGVEAYGELDLIEKTVRASRMTNIGVQVYIRYRINSTRDNYFFPNPAGGRKDK